MGTMSYIWPSKANNAFLILVGNSIDDLTYYRTFAMYLAANGITVIGFDLIESNKQWINRLGDMNSLINEIDEEYPKKPISLCGISSGAYFVREYASLYPESVASIILLEHSCPASLQIKSFLRKAKKLAESHGENAFPSEMLKHYSTHIDEARYSAESLTYKALIDIAEAVKRIGAVDRFINLTKNLPIISITGDNAPAFANGHIMEKKIDRIKFPDDFKVFQQSFIGNSDIDLLVSSPKRDEIYNSILEWIYCHSYQKVSRKDAGLPEKHYYNHLIPFADLTKKKYEKQPVWIAIKDGNGEYLESQAYISFKHPKNGLIAIINTPSGKRELFPLEYTSKWFAFSEPPFDDLFIRKKEEVGDRFFHVFRYDLSDPIPLAILKEELTRTGGLALWLDASWRLISGEPGWAILYVKPTGEIAALKDGKHHSLPDADYIKLWKVQTEKPK